MRKNEFISIRSIGTQEETKAKEIERGKFLNLMEGIKEYFVNNNEISKKFLEIIPEVEEIEIDQQRNSDCDVPFIVCKMNDGSRKVLNIPRTHKIIWAILNEYTK